MAKQAQQKKNEPSQQETASAMEAMAKTINNLRMQLQDKTKYEQIQELSARLTFLFKTIENRDAFPKEYVEETVNEIITILPVGEAANPEGENQQGPDAMLPDVK